MQILYSPLDATLKNLFRQITLGRIRDNRGHTLSRAQPTRYFQRGEYYCSSARACQHAFLRRQPLDRRKGGGVGHCNYFIAYGWVKRLWDEVIPDPFHFVRPGRSAPKHRTLGGHGDRQQSGNMLLHIACYAREGATGAAAQNDGIDFSAHLFEKFHRSGFVVIIGIRRILELSSHECSVISGDKLFGTPDCALHALFVWSALHMRSQGLHDRYFLPREILWNKQLHFVAAIHPDQRQPDASVAGCSFDDGPTGRKFTLPLGPADDPDGGAVFHAASWIQVFEFGENVSRTGGSQPLQSKDRRSADQVRNVVGDAQMGNFRVFQVHATG